MHIIDIILFIEAFLLLLLSIFVTARNPGSPIHQSFAVMVFGSSMWVGANFDQAHGHDLLVRITFFGAILIAMGIYYFSYYFPFRDTPFSHIKSLAVLLVGIFLIATLFFSKLFIQSVDTEEQITNFGWVYHIFALYFLSIWAAVWVRFIRKFRKADGIHRWQLRKIFYALGASLIAGVTTNLLLPWIFQLQQFQSIGPLFSIVFFGYSAYILFGKLSD